MGVNTWYGFEDDDFTNANNWIDEAGTHAVPIDADSIYFTRRAIHGCLSGGKGQGALNFVDLVVGPAYQHSLGRGSDPLTCSADVVQISGGRDIYLAKGSGTFDDVTIRAGRVFVRNPNNASGAWRLFGGALVVVGSGTKVLGELFVEGGSAFCEGTVTELILKGGSVVMALGSTLTLGNIEGGELRLHGDTVTTLEQSGGTVFENSQAPPATHNISGGVYTFRENTWGLTAIDLNTVNVSGGMLDLRSGHANVGTAGGTISVFTDEAHYAFDAGRTIAIT